MANRLSLARAFAVNLYALTACAAKRAANHVRKAKLSAVLICTSNERVFV
jgi:hypothetical protein